MEKVGAAAIYMGETSRSINERSREHWQGYRGAKKEDNHMWKHQQLEHGGREPDFTMKVVGGSHSNALVRQVSEAVRIRRRGGETAILNSKAEYNRCHIPRLQVEKEEEQEKKKRSRNWWGSRDLRNWMGSTRNGKED